MSEGYLEYEVIPWTEQHNCQYIGFFVITLKDGYLKATYANFDPMYDYEFFYEEDLEASTGEEILGLANDLKEQAVRIQKRLIVATFPAIL